jgi:PAS domain S-box-containing protein
MSDHDSASAAWNSADARASLALAVHRRRAGADRLCGSRRALRFVNRAYERWFGLDRSQIVGRRLVDLVGEAAYARAKRYIDRALAGETVTYDGELAYELAGFRHIEAQFTPDFAPDGEVVGYHVMVTDISTRKTGERELSRLLHQERRRTALLELGRELREETDPKAVAARACAVLAVQMSAPRAGYWRGRSRQLERADRRRMRGRRLSPAVGHAARSRRLRRGDERRPARRARHRDRRHRRRSAHRGAGGGRGL